MRVDRIENTETEIEQIDLEKKMRLLHSDLESRIGKTDEDALTQNEGVSEIADEISEWLSDGDSRVEFDESKIPDAMDIIHRMSLGEDIHGIHTLGLEEIAERKINEQFKNSNIRQQAGFAAEIIGTAKDNMLSLANDTGIKTFRADDRPDLYDKNDQYVDKVTFDSEGKLLDRIQVKFIGHDGESCLQKMNTPNFDKYLYEGKVDKIEIPSDFYDEIRNGKLIESKLESLNRQLKKVKELNKPEAEDNIRKQIDRLEKIDSMLMRSSVTLQDAIDARLNPREYIHTIIKDSRLDEALTNSFHEGIDAGREAFAKSSVEHLGKVLRQEEKINEAVQNIAIDSSVAAFDSARMAFIDTLTADEMRNSADDFVISLKDVDIPPAVLYTYTHAYDVIMDFGQGNIDAKEMAYQLGDIGARNVGKVAGTVAGAAVGTHIPGVGSHTGALVGGAVGTAVASTAYKSAVKYGSESAEVFANAAKESAEKTVAVAKQYFPEKVDTVRDMLNNFSQSNNLPFAV